MKFRSVLLSLILATSMAFGLLAPQKSVAGEGPASALSTPLSTPISTSAVLSPSYCGIPWGWGYFSGLVWPDYFVSYPWGFGYSYWPYYNYQPYYATYGVISYSVSTGKGGYAWGYATKEAAAETANFNCSAQAPDCRAVVWVQGGCAAIATSAPQNSLGWAYATNKLTARDYAVRACQQQGGTECVAKAWVCSF